MIKATFKRSTIEHQALSYALKVTIVPDNSEGLEYPHKLFIMQVSTPTMISGDTKDFFINVATPVDIEEIPEDSPDLSNDIPYYRTNEITLWFRCLEDLERTKNTIDADIAHFIKTYAVLNNENEFKTIEEKTYG